MGEIISFYSYKGGVGRSMALANVATLLAHRGRRVLVVDFDLEAPGLHRYFLSSFPRTRRLRQQPDSGQLGTIDFFCELSELFSTRKDSPQQAIASLLDSGRFGYSIPVRSPAHSRAASLDFWSAGLFDKDYASRVHDYPWDRLYEESREVFTQLAEEWKARYDYVLLDSRTGISDLGSVSTVILADKLVLAFTLNEQSLHGVTELGRQAVRLKRSIDASRPLALFPLLSRVDEGEEQLNRRWSREAARRFASLFEAAYGRGTLDFSTYFDAVRIPYRGYYAYGEKIAVEKEKPATLGSLAEGYERFLDCVLGERLEGWQERIRSTVKPIRMEGGLLVNFENPSALSIALDLEHVVKVPEQFPARGATELRDLPINRMAWEWALREMEQGVERATQTIQGTLHVFATMPYPAAVFLGRCLDDLARTRPIQLHQLDPSSHTWVPFSGVGVSAPEATGPSFHPLERVKAYSGRAVLLAIEGMTPISKASLSQLGIRVNASIYLLQPRQRRPLPPGAGAAVVEELRTALLHLREQHPSAPLHVVTSAPVALLIELGRLLPPSVYKSVTVHQFEPGSGSYVPVLDVITREVVVAQEPA
jgi:hypothetical protein